MINKEKFATKADLFKFLKDNKDKIIAQKKYEMKRADAISYQVLSFLEKAEKDERAIKAADDIDALLAKDKITVRSIINTTNLLDSHSDVHIKGIWKKSLKEQKNLYLLQEHQMKFDHIISDNVNASAKTVTWESLGFNFEGNTEALVFDSEIEKARNGYMFDQYARGYVKNHSVGMRYVQLHLCVDSTDKYYIEEKENWDKYIGEVANRDEAEEKGYFWAVTEAKVVEGSAVPVGSNWATPTQSVKEISEPPSGTCDDIEPPSGTRKGIFNSIINFN